MKKLLLSSLLLLTSWCLFAQKTVYIPNDFSTDPALSAWSYSRSYQSANFVIFWGPVVGTNPATYSNASLRFTPQAVADTLEKSYVKYVTNIGFCSDAPTKNLGKYKVIIVMNDTWAAGGPSGWAFGGAYDNTIGAMWVHPDATRDGGVLSHEFAHSLQTMIGIQENTVGGGFVNYDPAGFFYEGHANFMRAQLYPRFAGDDLPRRMATSSFHWSSTRHHYSNFDLLFYMQQLEGITMVNRLWKESVANEHPLITYRRLKGWNQSQLNNFIYDYAKREVTYDYTVNNYGAIIRSVDTQLKNNEAHYMWRRHTILNQINATTGRYIVPDASAPQEYGYNIIPLYPTCSSKYVVVKFKGHTENSAAGWRYGFVAVKANGTTVRYGAVSTANESQISFQMASDETSLYLVVVGAPTTHVSYLWEAGFPKIKRFPYELRIANANPEGYQSTFRSQYKVNGHAHSNGGGWVENTSTVASTVYVGPKAIVRGYSNLSGTVRVEGTAWVENATASGSVKFSGNASVTGGTYTNTAQITDNAVLNNTTVSGSAIIKGDAILFGDTFGSSIVVGGDAEIGSCSSGVYLQTPHPNNGRSDCDGKLASDATNTEVNSAYSNFTDAQMAFTGTISCTGTAKLSTEGTDGENALSIYPNPAGATFTVELAGFEASENVTLYLYDPFQGRQVMRNDIQRNRKVTIATAPLKLSGKIYVLKAVSNTKAMTKKLILAD